MRAVRREIRGPAAPRSESTGRTRATRAGSPAGPADGLDGVMDAEADGERRLDRLTWPELAGPAREALPLVALPLGSTEQHGPHLPAGTDTIVAAALAAALAAHRPDVLVAPALAYGASGEHAGFPATMSLGTAVLELAVVELVRSLDATARGIVLVNGHGGNAVAVGRAARLLAAEGRRVLVWAPRPSTAGRGGQHAGRDETSLMLHLAPGLVRSGAAAAGPSPPPTVAELVRHGVRALSPNGVLGDPAGASAAEGERLFTDLRNDLVAAVAARDPAPTAYEGEPDG